MKINYFFQNLFFILYCLVIKSNSPNNPNAIKNQLYSLPSPLAIEFINSTAIAIKSLASEDDAISPFFGVGPLKRRCTPKICGVKAIINSLEATTGAFVKSINAAGGPGIQCLLPDPARLVLNMIQNISVPKCPATIEDITITVANRTIVLTIVRPLNSTGILPVIMYFHGGGWELGDQFTFDRLVRQLASGAHAALVFVNYTRTPEAQFPVANEQAYAATNYIVEHAAELNLDPSRLAVVGDSVGGNMSIYVAMMAKKLKGPSIIQLVLFYPVTQACFNTPSYKKYAECIWLTRAAMIHYCNLYEPNVAARQNPLLSPLRASCKELSGLPPTLLITGQNDVLRCDGEWFARKLARAGVPVKGVRFLGTIHDFVLLNPLASTPATRAALCLAQTTLRKAFRS